MFNNETFLFRNLEVFICFVLFPTTSGSLVSGKHSTLPSMHHFGILPSLEVSTLFCLTLLSEQDSHSANKPLLSVYYVLGAGDFTK